MIKFVDLFAGIGGIRVGFEQACDECGLPNKCVYSCEIDKKACETYEINFKHNPYGDVRQDNIDEPFDFLLAGFPCQPFSYAGKMEGMGDTRGTLFFEIERILRTFKPKAFLLENVRGLTSHDNGKTFRTIITHLENIGYGVAYLMLNSSDFGVPQNRMRVYILGILGDKPSTELSSGWGASDSHKFKSSTQLSLLNKTKYPRTVVKDILQDEVEDKYWCSEKFTDQLVRYAGNNLDKLHGYRLIDFRNGNSIHSWDLGIKGVCTKDEIIFMNELVKNRRKKNFGTHQDGKKLTLEQIRSFYKKSDIFEIMTSLVDKGYLKENKGTFNPTCGNMSFEVFKFLDPESVSITLVSSDIHKLGIIDRGRPRRVTPRECARLQGYPDTFILHPNDVFAYKQIGNSVSVPVVKEVLKDFFIKNSVFKI